MFPHPEWRSGDGDVETRGVNMFPHPEWRFLGVGKNVVEKSEICVYLEKCLRES